MVCPLGFPMKHGEYYGNTKNGEHFFPSHGHGTSLLALFRLSTQGPSLFTSNVEQPDSRGPSSSVSYASGMEEGGSVDPFWGQGWKWVSGSPGAALCHPDS